MSRTRWVTLIVGELALLLMAGACTTPQHRVGTAAGSLLDSHVHDFALAYCLRSLGDKNLPEPEAQILREQGDRWGQVMVEQSRGDFTEFFVIVPAIDAALAATPMALVKVEATGGSATAPVYYCVELLRQPAVMHAMAQAKAGLAADYAGS